MNPNEYFLFRGHTPNESNHQVFLQSKRGFSLMMFPSHFSSVKPDIQIFPRQRWHVWIHGSCKKWRSNPRSFVLPNQRYQSNRESVGRRRKEEMERKWWWSRPSGPIYAPIANQPTTNQPNHQERKVYKGESKGKGIRLRLNSARLLSQGVSSARNECNPITFFSWRRGEI